MKPRALIIIATVILMPVLAMVVGCRVASHLARKDLERVHAETAARGDTIDFSTFTGRVPYDENAWPDLEAAFDLLKAGHYEVAEGLAPDEENDPFGHIGQIRAGVEAAADFFETLERGLEYPRCEFPRNWEDGPAVSMPELSDIRASARALAVRATLRALDGRTEQAARDIERIIRLGDYLSEEPVLISLLVRAACHFVAQDASERLLSYSSPAEETLCYLQRLFEKVDFQENLVYAFRGERDILGQTIFKWIREGRTGIPGNPQMERSASIVKIIAPWIIDRNEVYYLETMNRYIDAASLPWPESRRQSRTLSKEIEQEMNSGGVQRITHFITQLTVPVLGSALDRVKQGEINSHLTALGMAAERHRQAEGEYPDALDALRDKGLVKAIPLDPFSGKQLIYRKEPEGFIIYSVGYDDTDDGGSGSDDVIFEVEKKSPPAKPKMDVKIEAAPAGVSDQPEAQ